MPDVIKVENTDALEALRAASIANRLTDIRSTVENRFFEMCELLTEVHEKQYHTFYGYASFGEWVEQGSGLDMSARTGFYYVNISKKAKALGLERDYLAKVGITKLKEVFSLDTAQHADSIKGLLEAAPKNTVEEVKAKVSQVKTNNGQEPTHYMALRLDASVKQNVDKAFKLARLQYGDQVDEYGEVKEASHSKCMELVCLAYLQDVTNYPDGMSEGDL